MNKKQLKITVITLAVVVPIFLFAARSMFSSSAYRIASTEQKVPSDESDSTLAEVKNKEEYSISKTERVDRNPNQGDLVIKDFYLGMSEADAVSLLKILIGDGCKITETGHISKGVETYVYMSPAFAARSSYPALEKTANFIDIDQSKRTLVGIGFSGATCDEIFDSADISFDDFSEQFMNHHGILTMEPVSTNIFDLVRYKHTTVKSKIELGHHRKISKFKIFSMRLTPKTSF